MKDGQPLINLALRARFRRWIVMFAACLEGLG
jgi:hypothetical protein